MAITFTKWGGNLGLEQYIINNTGCKPYSGAGINIRQSNKTAILKSVDNTYYYDDDLTDINNPKYTLFGNYGDQDETEIRFNEPLLNLSKIENIYLYKVSNSGKTNIYSWYGKYKIIDIIKKQHIDKNRDLRTIIVLSLKKF